MAGLVRLALVTPACPSRRLGSKEVTLVKKWNKRDTLDITHKKHLRKEQGNYF